MAMHCPSHDSRSLLSGKVQGEWLSARMCAFVCAFASAFASMCLCVCCWKAPSKCWQGGVKPMTRGSEWCCGFTAVSQANGGRHTWLPTDWQVPTEAFVKRAPSRCASSLTAVKDDDTEITHSANADTHGACTPFWACHSVGSVGR